MCFCVGIDGGRRHPKGVIHLDPLFVWEIFDIIGSMSDASLVIRIQELKSAVADLRGRL